MQKETYRETSLCIHLYSRYDKICNNRKDIQTGIVRCIKAHTIIEKDSIIIKGGGLNGNTE